MGPRKKSKPNPESENNERNNTSNNEPSSSKPNGPPVPNSSDAMNVDIPAAPSLRAVSASQASQSSPQLVGNGSAVQKQVENRASWYGSWKGKAKPVAELARDNAPASPATLPASPSMQPTTRPASGERQASGPTAPSPRRYMSGSIRQKSKGDVLPASTSNVSVVSGNARDVTEPDTQPVEPPKETVPEPPLPPDPLASKNQDESAQAASKTQQRPASGWFGGWWSRPDGYVEKLAGEDKKKADDKAVSDAQRKPLPDSPAEERTQPKMDQAQLKPNPSEPIPVNATGEQKKKKAPSLLVGSQRSSWFWLWSSQQNAQNDSSSISDDSKPTSKEIPKLPTEPSASVPSEDAQAVQSVPPEIPPSGKKDQRTDPSRKSSGWAFWSRDVPDSIDASNVHKQVGEIAVADTPSQSNPEAAQFNEPSPQAEEPPKLKEKPKSVRGRGKSKDSESASSTPAKSTPAASPERKSTEPKVAAVAGKPAKEHPKETTEAPKEDKNILLPDFNNTYSILQQPSIWQRIQRMFISDAHSFPGPHLHLTSNPPRIKKALAIGIHGFFPSPMYQKILGQPTGTSIRFANCAAQAVKSWTESRGYECEIEKVALEGEGFINDRVDTLWKLLLNWIEHIRQADFILVAAHSQGVPVAVMIIAKLIQFGCVSNARIGICAMAGISLGPFAEYKTRIFGGSALELFDFTEPRSKVSETYRTAVEEVLKAGVRIVYVGSIDDQLVSLDSSTFSPVSHPNIYRAVFIDGRLHASDFLTQLIGFTLKLRNLGLPDHGLIRELSPALAGSLYTGDGHSSLHNYMPIYSLAVRHALETVPADSAAIVSNEVRWGELKSPAAIKEQNPYFLPWALRGVLEEEAVRREMGDEVEKLLKSFEEWKPVSKGMKDVKFRLEAVRSKL